MATEERHGAKTLTYKVVESFDGFEIRKYEPFLIVSIKTEKMVGSQGFRYLFNYISGDNKEGKEIPMTAPVLNRISVEEASMAFVMPEEFSKENIPKPLQEELLIKEMPSGYYAVLSFKGFNNQLKIEQKIKAFEDLLEKEKLEKQSDFYLARFDPPFTLPPLRKNEILVRIQYDD